MLKDKSTFSDLCNKKNKQNDKRIEGDVTTLVATATVQGSVRQSDEGPEANVKQLMSPSSDREGLKQRSSKVVPDGYDAKINRHTKRKGNYPSLITPHK
jgi:hypothetical protein